MYHGRCPEVEGAQKRMEGQRKGRAEGRSSCIPEAFGSSQFDPAAPLAGD